MSPKVSNKFTDADFRTYFVDQFEAVRCTLSEMDAAAERIIATQELDEAQGIIESGARDILKILRRANSDLFLHERPTVLPEKYQALALRVCRFRRRREKKQ